MTPRAIGRRIVKSITCTTRPARHCPWARINAVDIHAPASALSFIPPPPTLIRTLNPLPVVSICSPSPHPMRKRPANNANKLSILNVTTSSIAISFVKSTIAVTPVAVASHADPHIRDCGHRRPCGQCPAYLQGRRHRSPHPLPLQRQRWAFDPSYHRQLIVVLFMVGCLHYHRDAYPLASLMLASRYPPLCPMSYPSFFTPLAPRPLTWHTIVG